MENNSTITVYACGGTGVNIGRIIEEQCNRDRAQDDDTPFANVEVYYIDTSDSNTKRIKTDNVYLFDGIDGSGSDRKRNKDIIENYVPDILQNMPPKDLSVVIHSTSGGSGSVIGPMLTSRLLKEKKATITAAVLTSETAIHLKNTVMVLGSFEGMGKARNRVLPVMLCNNSENGEANVNATISNAVQVLAILYSGKLDRLDSADLDNWINFNNVTSHEVGAVLLDITNKEIKLQKNEEVCSVVTIVNDSSTNANFQSVVEYQKVGIISSNNQQFKDQALHFVLIDGAIQEAYKNHMTTLEEMNKQISSRPRRVSIANESNTEREDGIGF